jgi:molybdopterin-containing oxidoreductase family membrane subunit
VFLGGLLPLFLLYHPTLGKSRFVIAMSSLFVILGGLAQMYVIIVGGQAYPLSMFPGKDVSSSFFDGVVSSYTPSLPEIALGVSGFAIAFAAVVVAIKVLRFVPESLADEVVDPHYSPEKAAAAAEAHA